MKEHKSNNKRTWNTCSCIACTFLQWFDIFLYTWKGIDKVIYIIYDKTLHYEKSHKPKEI